MKNKFFGLQKYYKRIALISGIVLGSLLVIAALLVVAVYQLTPQLARYNAQIAMELSEIIERPVTVDYVAAKWEGFGPVIHLNNVKIWDEAHHSVIMSADDVEAKISILDFLLTQTLVPKGLVFDNLLLTVQQTPQSQYEIVGFTESTASANAEVDFYE
ncbi:MAG: hypothetical protein ACHP9Y_04065, partial [Gammaproteobacteria bacterium]